jgi:type II secretory pathway component GspD/PulD (secretin)
MAVIEQAIVALDIPIPQIMLEVEMLDVNKNLVERLGIKYADSLTTYMFTAVLKSATVTTPFPFAGGLYSDKTQTQGAKQFTQGTLNLKDYNAYLDFLKQQSDTRTLARPRIRTMSNETAEIMITTQEAIGSITVQQGTGANVTQTITAERVETGIHLRVTPQVNSETGDITMFIYPKVKDTVASVLNPSTWKDPEERSVKSILRMKDGDTVIIGGLIRKDDSETVTKLPFLGDLPLIGGAFRHKYKDKGKERELLVFITPRIIKDSGVMLAQAKKGAFPEREQGASSGVKRDLAINSTLNKFEKKKKR